MVQIGNIFQGVMQQARQLAGNFTDPQQIIQRYFPNAPDAARQDPEQLISWLQQTGKVTPQQVQMARQLMGK